MKKTDNEWPRMFYHATSAAYIICDNEDQVPDGYVDHPASTEQGFDTDLQPDQAMQVRIDNDLALAETDGKEMATNDAKPPSLEDFETTREEAIALLTEEKVKFKKNATNATLALLLADILEE